MVHTDNHFPYTTQKSVVQPTAPGIGACPSEAAIYSRFVRYLRHVPNSRIDIKILSSIQFTADILGHSDAYVAKTLVDFGLRAPRMAFPSSFLSYVDASLQRVDHAVGGPSGAVLDLARRWDRESQSSRVSQSRNFGDIHETTQWCA